MRRVGQMDRVVTIQRVTATTINDFGQPVQTWADLVTLRAKSLLASRPMKPALILPSPIPS